MSAVAIGRLQGAFLVVNGTLSKMYLLDAAAELLWISLWRRQRRAELP
jgi:hypothetical protein